MADIVQALKARARIFHKSVLKSDKDAIKRLRILKEFCDIETSVLLENVQRRHCLSVIAQDLGFTGWSHLTNLLKGANDVGFGTCLHPKSVHVHWNIWVASYDEAITIQQTHGGFILGYKNQYIVVDEDYIKDLGLDPNDVDFEEMGRDWIKPKSNHARIRLFGKVFDASLGAI